MEAILIKIINAIGDPLSLILLLIIYMEYKLLEKKDEIVFSLIKQISEMNSSLTKISTVLDIFTRKKEIQ